MKLPKYAVKVDSYINQKKSTMAMNSPVVASFLLLYSLRCGCVTIFVWTLFRSLSYLIFFILGIAEVFLLRSPILVNFFYHEDKAPEDAFFLIFYSYVLMIATEASLFVHMLHLGIGLLNDNSGLLAAYLICRFGTLLAQVTLLITLCITHSILIGWYLGFLLFVVLEFYSFIIVNSYYVDLKEEKIRLKCKAIPTYHAQSNAMKQQRKLRNKS